MKNRVFFSTDSTSGNSNYGNESISMLKGADRIRKRPEVMLSTRDKDGMRHTVTEIIGNSLDEMSAGYGDILEVTYNSDYSITVRDYGRGVPLGWNEKEQQWNWHLVYNEMYAGAKYDDSVEIDDETFNSIDLTKIKEFVKKFTYLFPIGTNGLGGFATQATSEFFEVKSYHNKVHGDSSTPMVRSRMRFEKGNPVLDELEVLPTDEKTGTEVTWKPDLEVFTGSDTNDIDFNWLLDLCSDVANLKGYTIKVCNKETGFEKTIEGNNIEDLLRLRGGKSVVNDKTYMLTKAVKDISSGKKYIAMVDVALAVTEKKVNTVAFHNTTKMLRGVTYSGAEVAISEFFSSRGSERNVKLVTGDYVGLVSCVISTYSTLSSYENQTKQGVSNNFLFHLVYNTVLEILNVEWAKGNKDLKEAVDSAIYEAETRAKVKEYEKQQRAAKRATRSIKKVDRLAECRYTDPKKIELWIPEGNSAGRSLKDARKSEFQAILPVRGKVLNVTKASLEKIIDCTIIKELFAVLGVCMDLPGSDLFDIRDLKYDKIIIATDADEDGYQIRVLLFLIFYKLAPKLLKAGKVYIAETPLFELILTNGNSVFAYDKNEKEKMMKEYEGQVREVKRSKGLGENDQDMMWNTTMNPETRRLIKLDISNEDSDSADIIDCLFGRDSSKQRKNIILDSIGIGIDDIIEIVD